VVCYEAEFNFSEFFNLWAFGRTPWKGDQPDARPLPTQGNTTKKNVDTYPYLERDSNQQSQRSSCQRQ